MNASHPSDFNFLIRDFAPDIVSVVFAPACKRSRLYNNLDEINRIMEFYLKLIFR